MVERLVLVYCVVSALICMVFLAIGFLLGGPWMALVVIAVSGLISMRSAFRVRALL